MRASAPENKFRKLHMCAAEIPTRTNEVTFLRNSHASFAQNNNSAERVKNSHNCRAICRHVVHFEMLQENYLVTRSQTYDRIAVCKNAECGKYDN